MRKADKIYGAQLSE